MRFQCCFCGKLVDPVPPDVGSLIYTTCRTGPSNLQKDQEIFCHASCLRAVLHPSVKLYAVDLVEFALTEIGEPPEEDEQVH